MFDIIEYANCEKVSGAVLSVDLRKAFDWLKWSFIFKNINFFGFSCTTIKWIKISYKKSNAELSTIIFLVISLM